MKFRNDWSSLEELSHYFSDEHDCINYLYNMKWPHGFECPRCHNAHHYVIRTRRLPLYECSSCHHQTSLTTDTIMENSRTSLRKWIMAIWLITQHDVSINAVQLSSIIQVTYKTAWSILHKIRSIISAVDLDSPLEGNVQGIVEYHCKPTFRSTLELLSYEHPLIVAASITADEHIIALKMKLVNRQHLRDRTLRPIASSTFNDLHTCADPSNIEIIPHPYRALRFRHLKDAFQQARRWMITTFHGIGQKYLQRYLDEFCFRYNARNHPLSAYERLVSMCMYTNYATHVRSNAPSYMYRAA